MRLRRNLRMSCLLAWTLVALPGHAQSVSDTLPLDTAGELRTMAQGAGIIFTGQVLAIRRAHGAVEIDFQVDDAIRGVTGGAYTLRAWSGLWAGNAPLSVGRRYLMLLHAPGAAGLSSPVGGGDGAIPISGGSGAVRQGANKASTDGRAVDLRWIQARAEHVVEYGGSPGAPPAQAGVRLQSRAAQVDFTLPEQVQEGVQGVASYAAVIGKLRSWEKPDAPH